MIGGREAAILKVVAVEDIPFVLYGGIPRIAVGESVRFEGDKKTVPCGAAFLKNKNLFTDRRILMDTFALPNGVSEKISAIYA